MCAFHYKCACGSKRTQLTQLKFQHCRTRQIGQYYIRQPTFECILRDLSLSHKSSSHSRVFCRFLDALSKKHPALVAKSREMTQVRNYVCLTNSNFMIVMVSMQSAMQKPHL